MNYDRIQGVIMLKAPVYREIADDLAGTQGAAIVFIVATLISGFFNWFVTATGLHIGAAIVGAIGALVVGLIGWVVTAWVLSFVATQLGGRTSTSEMLRVTGYVAVFNVVGVLNIFRIIPLLGWLAGLITFVVWLLSLVGYVIGVREAAEFSTTNAVITAVVAVVVNIIIASVIGGAIIGGAIGLFFLGR